MDRWSERAAAGLEEGGVEIPRTLRAETVPHRAQAAGAIVRVGGGRARVPHFHTHFGKSAPARCEIMLMRPAGFEPATNSLEGCCSIHLSYGRAIMLPRTHAPNLMLLLASGNAAALLWTLQCTLKPLPCGYSPC